MTTFNCSECDYSAKEKGECPSCHVPLKQCCPVCLEETEKCTCTGDVPQTKGPGLH